jgi:hypothetical protein
VKPRVAASCVLIFFAAVGCQKGDSGGVAPEAAAPPAASTVASAPIANGGSSPSSASSDDPLAALSTGPVVREQIDVPIDGSTEKWRLEWTKPPVPDCVDASDFETCPCAAFAFGEKGYLDLVRTRTAGPEERLPLSTLFDGNSAHLRRWPVTKADTGKKPDLADLAVRPIETVMKLGDYDHDGRASEFVLVVGSQPCGHAQSVVVGVSKSNQALHVFSSADAPGTPLVLEHASDWEKVRAKPAVDLVQVSCGDHGADTETSLHVTADGSIHVQTTSKKCAPARQP